MSAWDDPNSRLMSNRQQTYRRYKYLLKKGRYEELLRDYLKARCAAPEIHYALDGLMELAKKNEPKANP